jgi:hypothetical protein
MEPSGPPRTTSQRETWEESLHHIKEATTDQLDLTKYRCLCAWYCGGGRLVLRSIIRDHFRKYGRDQFHTKLVVVYLFFSWNYNEYHIVHSYL